MPQDGTQVIVPLDITSTSETALVAQLPAKQPSKEIRDIGHNPSGSLVFTASTATPAGTSTPAMTVNSGGQTASTNFTLVVTE